MRRTTRPLGLPFPLALALACTGTGGADTEAGPDTQAGPTTDGGETTGPADPLEPACPDGGDAPLTQFLDYEGALGGSAQARFAPPGARDVDGDGFDDLVFGGGPQVLVAWGDFGASQASLEDWVADGNGFVIETDPVEHIVHTEIVGDVNGDGFADIGVFAEEEHCECPGDDGCFGESYRRAYLVHGSASAATIQITDVKAGSGGFVVEYDAPMEYCGASERVHFAGDVDADGTLDFLVDRGWTGALILGKADTDPISLTTPGDAGYEVGGRGLSAAGDVDGDGVDDLVGYEGQDARVFLGQPGAAPIGGFRVPNTDGANFPSAFGLGDVNGDGLGDIAIEDTRDRMFHVALGRAGAPDVPSADLMAGIGGFSVVVPAQNLSRYSIAGVGDVNGDGYADLAIGDRSVTGGDGSEHRVYIMYGGPELGAPALCDLAMGVGGFGIAGVAERPVGLATGTGSRLAGRVDVLITSIGGVYVAAAP